jgi:two-component system response regulator
MTSRTILLVEDNPNDELLALMAFKKYNVSSQIVVARDGVEAVDFFFKPGKELRLPAVVFLDLKLPRMDGLEVLQRLRADERTKLVPVVMLTSSSEESDINRSYALGANSYVCKPVDFDQYTEAIGRIGLYWTTMNHSLVSPVSG